MHIDDLHQAIRQKEQRVRVTCADLEWHSRRRTKPRLSWGQEHVSDPWFTHAVLETTVPELARLHNHAKIHAS